MNLTNSTNAPALLSEKFWDLTHNLISEDPSITPSEVLDGGVMRVRLAWSEFCCNLGSAQLIIAAGHLDLNTVDVPAPTTYYLYVNPSGVVERSTTDPLVTYGANAFVPLARARIDSNAGTARIFYLRRMFIYCENLLSEIGEYSADVQPVWMSGFAPVIDGASGEIDVEAGAFQRLLRQISFGAATNAEIVLDDETVVADLEDITTYSDGSAITAGKYHKILLMLLASSTSDYRLLAVRQAPPTVEYATLEEARIDAERRAATGAPSGYLSSTLPLAYIEMLLSDASDLDTQDLRESGVTGGGGGGGGIADHGLLAGLGDDDHAQYTLADGTRAFTGDIDLGGNDVTNVGDVDGVDVSAHVADADAHHVAFTPTDYSDARAYGSIYVTGNGVGQAMVAGVPSKIAQYNTNGVSLNTTPDHVNDQITVANAGNYRITGAFTFQCTRLNQNVRFFAAVGGVASAIGVQTITFGTFVFGASFNGIIALGAGAVITVLATTSSNLTLTVQESHLTVERL